MARGIALVVVLPVRLVWDALTFLLRVAYRYLLEPLGRALGWLFEVLVVAPVRALWRYVLRPVGVLLWRHLLAPVGRGLAWLARWFGTYVIAPVARLLWRYLLVPLGLAVHRYLLRPLWRHVLVPVGTLLAWAWRYTAIASRAVGRALGWLGWVLVGWGAVRVYRYVVVPVGRVAREAWRSVRVAAREVRVALFG
ncbi:hypothetical protein ACIQUQ_14220 [Streptomyces sp. NPDC101118]|uniref:hypothetical protein n=1 Tax=Streptomyces sp. NPDC101118 TaxID=3366109 RepID=UPI00382CAACE